ncbi:MAG: squalene/phytoene synthase family protein [Hyphomicrobiaceae bacterium]
MTTEDEIVALARRHEPDRYLAALAAPAAVRGDLITLAAFAAEVRRIPRRVSDPLVGEIRLTWWREAIEAMERDAGAVAHPIAGRLAPAVRSGHFPAPRLTGLIDAMSFDLSPAAFADEAAREVYLSKTDGALFRLALVRLGVAEPPEGLIRRSATAYGLARAILALGGGAPLVTEADLQAAGVTIHQLAGEGAQARRRIVADRLGEACRLAMTDAAAELRALPEPDRIAMLPLAMVAPYRLWGLTGAGLPAWAPLTRVWRLWRAARSGKIGD